MLGANGNAGSECFVERQTSTDSTHLLHYGLLEAPSHELGLSTASFNLDLVEPLVESLEPGVGFQTWLWRLLAFTGPGWLMSIAYVDPGNLEADLQTGAQFGYTLLWALFAATFLGLGFQLVAARLGVSTRRHLAEHCQEHYPMHMRLILWFLTELAIIGSDIQEVIGCSIGLQLLIGLPLSVGVLVTAFAAFGFLFLERLGTRPLELFFGLLIAILAVSMGGLFSAIKPDTGAMLEGMVVPRLPRSAVQQVVGMLGCVVMPHNLFLHSALVQSRAVPAGDESVAITLFTIESTVAIITSLLINMSVMAVFAKGFYGTKNASDVGLRTAGKYLGDAYGDVYRIVWALGLCAAGQASTMTGAYAGQWVMQGYLQLNIHPVKRAVITRSLALVPCLTVAVYFGDGNTGLDQLNEYLNVLQSLVLPFAVVPLLTFAGSQAIMGDFVLSPAFKLLGWAATAVIMAGNMYLFLAAFDFKVSCGLGFGLAAYLVLILYTAWGFKKTKT